MWLRSSFSGLGASATFGLPELDGAPATVQRLQRVDDGGGRRRGSDFEVATSRRSSLREVWG
jgi:hypothetical protein